MKLKMKYTAEPWFYGKGAVTGKGNAKVADVHGGKEERDDNALLISCAPDMMKALLAEEAYTSMTSEEGGAILESLGYREGGRCAFVKALRKAVLKKLGLIDG